MLFDDRKLQPADLAEMMSCSIDTIEPYSFLLAPAYLYMRRNNRVVSVKAPLDFFTPDELSRIRVHQMIYFPKFVGSSVRFQTAGRLVKKVLNRVDNRLPRATFELMGEVSHIMSELWCSDLKIEPFFAAVFAQELCEPIDPELLVWARENAVVKHDEGLLLSGMFIFISVQLGWLNLNELSKLRFEIYRKTVKGDEWQTAHSEAEMIVRDLKQFIDLKGEVSSLELQTQDSEWAKLLSVRLQNWKAKLESRPERSPSIYGPNGFMPQGGTAA